MKANFIAIDWGSSNFRAYLLSFSGHCLETIKAEDGILHHHSKQFPDIFLQHLSPWFAKHGKLPVIMSGMIGSRQGWHEADYLPCPLNIKEIATKLLKINFQDFHIYIVPGLSFQNNYRADVMRGEEVQLLGALDANQQQQLICLPGTHVKWVTCEKHAITNFHTFMSGELYSLLSKQSILSKLLTPDFTDQGFTLGLADSQQPGDIMAHLFNVRASILQEKIPAKDARAYLSGLIIGHEIQSIKHLFNDKSVTIIADSDTFKLYQSALHLFDLQAHYSDVESASIIGLTKLARELLN